MFWRSEGLDESELALLHALDEAHWHSAWRQNPSTAAVANAAQASGRYAPSLAAALLTVGGAHAPLEATFDLLSAPMPGFAAALLLRNGRKVPGWGSGFVRGTSDPLWSAVDARLREAAPEIGEQLDAVTQCLHRAGKMVFPNPSAYTAAVAIRLGMPREVVPYLLVRGRLEAWSAIFARHLQEKEKGK